MIDNKDSNLNQYVDSHLKKAFDKIDVDHSGAIDLNEFTELYKNLDKGTISKDEIWIKFQQIDEDGNGVLSYEEFKKCILSKSTKMLNSKKISERLSHKISIQNGIEQLQEQKKDRNNTIQTDTEESDDDDEEIPDEFKK